MNNRVGQIFSQKQKSGSSDMSLYDTINISSIGTKQYSATELKYYINQTLKIIFLNSGLCNNKKALKKNMIDLKFQTKSSSGKRNNKMYFGTLQDIFGLYMLLSITHFKNVSFINILIKSL